MAEAATEASASQREPGRLRRLARAVSRGLMWSCLVLAVAAVVLVAWMNHRGGRAMEALRQAMMERNIPLTFEEWRDRHFSARDPSRDGSHFFRAAAALTQQLVPFEAPDVFEIALPGRTAQIHPQSAAAFSVHVAESRQLLELLDQAHARESHAMSLIDPRSVDLLDMHYLPATRALAQTLQLRGLHAQAIRDTPAAVEATRSVIRIAQDVGHQPTAVAHMVRISISRLAAEMAEDLLGRTTPDVTRLASLREAFMGDYEAHDLLRVMQGELVWVYLMTHDLDRLNFQASQTRRAFHDVESGEFTGDGKLDRLSDPIYRVWVALCPQWEQYEAASAGLEMLRDYDHAARLAADTPALARAVAEATLVSEPLACVTRFTLVSQARIAAAINALAVEQFRLIHGRWPKDLAEVERAMSLTLPRDLYTGHELHYRATDTGVVVYSVGDNFTDDGGYGLGDTHPDGRFDARDIVFRLYNPELRNSKPGVHRLLGDNISTDEADAEQDE